MYTDPNAMVGIDLEGTNLTLLRPDLALPCARNT